MKSKYKDKTVREQLNTVDKDNQFFILFLAVASPVVGQMVQTAPPQGFRFGPKKVMKVKIPTGHIF